MARHQVFISYCRRDRNWLEELQTHLKPYTRDGSVKAWSDEQIAPGSKWFEEIENALKAAKVAVLLVTPAFLNSDFIHDHELCPILQRAAELDITILWIPVRASAYQRTPIAKYQAAINPAKPLAEMKAERDRAWVQICEVIGKAVHAPERRRKASSAPPGSGRDSPSLRVIHAEEAPPRARRRRLASIVRTMAKGELADSHICPLVLAILSDEPDLEVATGFDRRWVAAGIRLSDEYFVRVRGSAGTHDWQRDFAQVAAPVLVAVTKSLERSAESQNVVVQLCDKLADRLRLQLTWPRSPDGFNNLTNAIYRACLDASSLESDEVLVVLRGLKVSGRRR